MRVLDLFSGIGGFSLGLERAGMKTVAFCEIDPFCREVLRKHWPDVPIHDDVRTAEFPAADVICGGFPCQDISNAGKRAGLAGERSGLWRELLRAICVVRPLYAIVENVAALLGRGMGTVLGDLAEIGYDAEWHCIPASAVGAPHRRDRVWIVADTGGEQYQGPRDAQRRPGTKGFPEATLANAARPHDRLRKPAARPRQEPQSRNGSGSGNMAHASFELLHGRGIAGPRWRLELANGGWWSTEPDVGRVAHGIPSRVDRLRSLGNAVVPQIPEMIGRAVLTAQ